MSHPDSNFQIGQMRHQEFNTEVGRYGGRGDNGISKGAILRLATVLSGGLIAALFVVQMIVI